MTGDQAMYKNHKPPDKPQLINNRVDKALAGGQQGHCEGLLGTHDDDLIFAGTKDLEAKRKGLGKNIKMKPAKYTPLTCAGLRIKREDEGTVSLGQEEYVLILKKQEENYKYENFRSYHHRLALITSSRPDVMATRNTFSQITD